MSYRPPATAPRGAWARFLHQMRQDRRWSQQRAFEELREGLHLGPKSRAAYAAIDMGHRQPSPDEAAFLAGFFGSWPNDPPEAPGPMQGEDILLAALDRHAAALERQTAALEALVEMMAKQLTDPIGNGRGAAA